MLKETMGHAGLSIYTEIATIVLVLVFLGVVFYAFVWRAKASWKHVAELPLGEDTPVRDGNESRETNAGTERSAR